MVFSSALSVSICFKYERSRVKLNDWWCSGGVAIRDLNCETYSLILTNRKNLSTSLNVTLIFTFDPETKMAHFMKCRKLVQKTSIFVGLEIVLTPPMTNYVLRRV